MWRHLPISTTSHLPSFGVLGAPYGFHLEALISNNNNQQRVEWLMLADGFWGVRGCTLGAQVVDDSFSWMVREIFFFYSII